ncbi:MAG: heavy-metal-associated domain-containing protein [Dermatophilaceae bacterium]|nr:heavy-metal-associated domain-containing protein [Dermatophilaceae bacterium]MBP9917506.1 heavy-metal-associated domain-containing protein [Dermatophilaceae bacterium]
MTTQTFQVDGMTCGHCAGHVTTELKALDGVSDVRVDLVAGGTSTVHVDVDADQGLTDEQIVAALDEAGSYTLVR